MSTNYANEKLALAIREHLLDVDAVPPTAEASKLARELAQVCLKELKAVGLRSETVERLFAHPRSNTCEAAPGRDNQPKQPRGSTAKYSTPV